MKFLESVHARNIPSYSLGRPHTEKRKEFKHLIENLSSKQEKMEIIKKTYKKYLSSRSIQVPLCSKYTI